MGWGDELIGSGIAKEVARRGNQTAFGDGRKVIWSTEAREIFRNNPNIIPPNNPYLLHGNVEWVEHYKGKRLYGTASNGVWTFNKAFSCTPGEVIFTQQEKEAALKFPDHAVLVEPNVKNLNVNKGWPFYRWSEVVRLLRREGYRVMQFDYGKRLLPGAEPVHTGSFRVGLAMMKWAGVYLGAEGGLHHGAAAVGTPAVVLFGGFIHPRTTGYASHINIFTGKEPCGIMARQCMHCLQAMDDISIEQVFESAITLLKRGRPSVPD